MNEQPAAIESGFALFTPRARLLRLIGSELISDDVVAVTELVKNAHDADATFVSIQFVRASSEAGEIIVRDDGHGMGLDTLLTRWMQPAGSAKGREGTRFTPSGRRVLGEKGVGRFAADKLAAHLELVSRETGCDREVHASFDWDSFDADDLMLSDVKNQWEVRNADWLDTQGTMLRLSRLRSTWTERTFRRLCTRLARLISPFDSGSNFRITIDSDEFPQYSGEISSGYMNVAPYTAEAQLERGSVTVRINGGRKERHVLRADEFPDCGPVRLRLYAFDLETDALAKLGPRAEVRAWLREWSGISVYRDGFRVWPYGESHDDWLRLDQRRVNNPVVRLSNNQVVGFAEISADANPELRDQTNREGLINNDEFQGLQRFVLFVMQLLEAERQVIRHPASSKHTGSQSGAGRAEREASALPAYLEGLAGRARGDIKDDLKRAAARARATASVEAQTRRRLLEGFSDLAAVGQASALVSRSAAAELNALKKVCEQVRRMTFEHNNEDVIETIRLVNSVWATVEQTAQRLQSLATPQNSAQRRRRGLDVVAELHGFRAMTLAYLGQQNGLLDVVATKSKSAVLRTEMRPELFTSIFAALLANSLEWRRPGVAPRITIEVSQAAGDTIEVVVSDNGRGISPGLERRLFEPKVSGREDGGGMGLAIAKRILEDHGGSIEVLIDRRKKGASFRIVLSRKKARATTPL
jgi:signal transduction histidine kinase